MINGVFVGLLFAAAAALAMQTAGAITAWVDAANVRDSDEPDVLTRGRIRELIWTLAVLAAAAVFIAFGIDWSARLVWERGEQWSGLGVLILTAAAAFLVGLVGVFAILRRERPTYARLRRDLRDRSTFTVTAEELTDFEARLARADQLRDRRPRSSLAVKIIGLVIVLGVGGFMAFVFFVVGSPAGWIFIAAIALEVIAFVVALRADVVRRGLLGAVLEDQRAEVVAMLERARIPQRGSVPGLRDRVSRALAILREKQR